MPSKSTHVVAPSSRHLRIRRTTWEPTLRRLLAHDEMCAVGSIRQHGMAGEMLLLVDELQVPDQIPNGHQRPPLDNWCAVVIDPDGTLSIPQMIRDLQPMKSQLVVIILLDRAQSNRCRMAVCEGGSVAPLDSCEIVGAGMLRLDSAPPTDKPDDELRASRTRGALGPELHDRLRQTTVTVVGLGRNGSQICFQLAGLGVGRLRLLDADVVCPENLDGMPGLTVEDIGRSKAEALSARLVAFRPDLSISYLERGMTSREAALMLYRPCDLYVTTVDDDAPRMGVSLLSNRTLTTHLDVGTLIRVDEKGGRSLYADIRLLLPGMCVACVGGLSDPDKVFYKLAAPDGSLQRGEPVHWSAERSGSLAHINAIACGTAVELWLRLLQGEIGAYWQRMAWEVENSLRMEGSLIGPVEQCQLCRTA